MWDWDRCSYYTSQDIVRKAVEYIVNVALSFVVFDVITGLHVMSEWKCWWSRRKP